MTLNREEVAAQAVTQVENTTFGCVFCDEGLEPESAFAGPNVHRVGDDWVRCGNGGTRREGA